MDQVTIAVVAQGGMGAGVARRLTENGARVLTLLDGRSAASRARAADAGMHDASLTEMAAADAILSIVPPGEALAIARRFAPALAASSRRAIYVDCNALDVRTVQAVGAEIVASGAEFVDGGIIGLPPKSGAPGPLLYLSGPDAARVAEMLAPLNLRVNAMDGPVGAASALKMSYAGITKGLSAIATLMILGAERAGAGAALHAELASSQPQLLARFTSSLPDMVPKAYRWVAEMHEIAAFLGEDAAGAAVFRGIAELYDRVAADAAGPRTEVALLEAFTRRA